MHAAIKLRSYNYAIRTSLLTACLLMMFVAFSSHAETTLQGLDENPDLKSYLLERVIAPLYADAETDPDTHTIRARLKRGLRSQGYYNATINFDPETKDQALVDPGPQSKISSYDILGYKEPVTLALKKGDPLVAARVLAAQEELRQHVTDESCAFTLSVKNRVYIDRKTYMADIFFDVVSSGDATFGPTSFQGGDNIDRDYLERFIKYEQDECWDPDKLEETKDALLQTGLIATARTNIPEERPQDGAVPVDIEITERLPRTVRLGANYNTSEGPGILAEWEHRNFGGSGEELTASTELSSILQRVGATFEKPFFLSDHQSLKLMSSLEREDTDAYEEFGLNLSASIEREISRFWTGSLGIGLDLLQVREDGEETENFGLVSMPGLLSFDSRDDALNPQNGHTLNLLVTPFVDTIGTTSPFLKTRVTGTTYIKFGESFLDSILALRTSIGSIWGAQANDIPASERFYAGGGGSIRGFGFQEAGPVDADNDPAGGRSLIETSAELRFKVTDTIGAAAFVDAGGVYDSSFPDFEGGAFIGAGLGVRYYTDFGPIRFDVAVPLNKKDRLDQNYQFYISIGQAF